MMKPNIHRIAAESRAGIRAAVRIAALACWLLTTVMAADGGRFTWAPTVKQVSASVVTVATTSMVARQRPPWADFPELPGLRDLLGPGGGPQRQEGLGSGVIVRGDGYVLTNHHVIRGAEAVKVTLATGDEVFTARVVGSDEKCDLAVLKIEPGQRSLEPVLFADSTQVEVGDTVLAIGNPLGVGQTVTMGIISAIGRGVGLIDYEDFLQTDAAINPGNSGGALVDAQGHLVGINTAILSRSGGNMGIGFAIPANLAHSVMEQIIDHGKVVRGQLGVIVQAVTPELATALKLAQREGALVSDVLPESAAAKAGIRSGDLITAFDRGPVSDPRTLRLRVAQVAIGRPVPVVLRRGQEEISLSVVLQAPVAMPAAGEDAAASHAKADADAIGLRLQDLDAGSRQRLGIPERVDGAAIAEVEADSRAERAGLRAGEVIQAIDGTAVPSAPAARQALKGRTGSVLLRVWAGGGSRFVVVPASGK